MGPGDRALNRGLRGARLARAAITAVGLLAAAGWAQAADATVQVLDAAGSPLSGAVVFLESAAAAAAVRAGPPAEISQAQRRFDPDVTVVTVGTAVNFPNRDTVRHHVYSFSEPKRFEIKLYVGTPADPVVFDRPGVSVLGCNIHDSMQAWVLIVQTPWFARAGTDGIARLKDVPAGGYQLRAWHPSLPPGAPAAQQAFTLPGTGGSARLQLLQARP